MKYFKIFAMFILSIIMLTALFLSVGSFRYLPINFLNFLGMYYIPSFIMLIGFIFLMIYVAKTKNIYSLTASLFLNISIIILLSNINIPAIFDILGTIKVTRIIIYIIYAIISSIFSVGFICLFFYFRNKSRKYIPVK